MLAAVANVFAEESQLISGQSRRAIGQSQRDGPVDFRKMRDCDVGVAARQAIRDLNALEDHVRETAFGIAVVAGLRRDRLPAISAFVKLCIFHLLA